MKILHITEAAATGTLTVVSNLANMQVNDGHTVIFAFVRREETPSNISNLFTNAVTLLELPNNVFSSIFSGTFALGKLLLATSPQIIHLHSSKAGFLVRLSYKLFSIKSKVLYTPHCISFMRMDIPNILKSTFILLERIANDICPSTYLACSVSEYNAIASNIPNCDIKLVENALPPTFPVLASKHSNKINKNKKFKVVTVGQIRKQKGVSMFAEVVRALHKIGPQYEFYWIGDSVEKDRFLKDELLAAGVTVTGWIEKTDLVELLVEADCYLSTSEWEGLPIAILEAQACSLPVVARKTAGNVDVIEDGNNGFTFSVTDEAVLKITHLLSCTNTAALLCENAQKILKERFIFERYAQHVMAAYTN